MAPNIKNMARQNVVMQQLLIQMHGKKRKITQRPIRRDIEGSLAQSRGNWRWTRLLIMHPLNLVKTYCLRQETFPWNMPKSRNPRDSSVYLTRLHHQGLEVGPAVPHSNAIYVSLCSPIY